MGGNWGWYIVKRVTCLLTVGCSSTLWPWLAFQKALKSSDFPKIFEFSRNFLQFRLSTKKFNLQSTFKAVTVNRRNQSSFSAFKIQLPHHSNPSKFAQLDCHSISPSTDWNWHPQDCQTASQSPSKLFTWLFLSRRGFVFLRHYNQICIVQKRT